MEILHGTRMSPQCIFLEAHTPGKMDRLGHGSQRAWFETGLGRNGLIQKRVVLIRSKKVSD
ncbi:hypothetical protein Hanom_Chr13g01244921 [Helianthus anomalus]